MASSRSSALPWGTPSTTSIKTTSANSFDAIQCAAVAPTLPAPTMLTFFRIRILLENQFRDVLVRSFWLLLWLLKSLDDLSIQPTGHVVRCHVRSHSGIEKWPVVVHAAIGPARSGLHTQDNHVFSLQKLRQ